MEIEILHKSCPLPASLPACKGPHDETSLNWKHTKADFPLGITEHI